MARKANATEAMKRASLIRAAAASGHPIPCAICKGPLLAGQRVAYDHGHALARGGTNTAENLFPVHDEKTGDLDCHTRKTAHPRGPHTAIGGDTFEAAKTGRLEREEELRRAVIAGEAERPHSRIKGQGFQKRPAHLPKPKPLYRRKMNGTVERLP